MDRTTRNSCCLCFSLRTGTFFILLYDLFWLVVNYYSICTIFQALAKNADQIKIYSDMCSNIQSAIKVYIIIYLICAGSTIIAICNESAKFLIPILALKILTILGDTILTLVYIFNLNKEQAGVAAIVLVVFAIFEGIVVYHWRAIQSYYKQLKGERWGEPVIYGQPRAPPYGRSPYGGQPQAPYEGQPGAYQEYPNDVRPQARGYPSAQDSSPQDNPRTGGQPRGKGSSPYGAQPDPYGGPPYNVPRVKGLPQTEDDIEKRADGQPLASSHPTAADN